MAYPTIKYKGQYTLKRVLTIPANTSLTVALIGALVTLNATGEVIEAPVDAEFFGVLRTLNTNDNVATVDFSGVHEFEASEAIDAGKEVIPASGTTVKLGTGVSTAVSLNQAASGEKLSIMFLN